MENESKDEKLESTEGENPESTSTVEEKRFTQKELDALIQSRVKREKDALTSASRTWEAEKADYESKLSTLENTLNELLAGARENLTEGEKTLLAKLPVIDQVDYLNSVSKSDKKRIPETPKGSSLTPDRGQNKPLSKFKI